MSCRFLAVITLCLTAASPLFALTAQDYLTSGRASLFDGTLTGIRQAHDTFEQGLNDASCLDCQTHRELLFFHAVSRIAMWAVREDGDPIDSAMELSKAFGTTITGEALRQIVITEPNVPENRYGQPDLSPVYLQWALLIVQFAESVGLPELEQTIAELEQIDETPEDRFRVFLTPEETSVFIDLDKPIYTLDIEVDFADVLLLKGMLYVIKGVMTAQTAYDTYVDPQARILTKIHENCFSVENDLLLPHPDFLKLLPTANDPADGAAILAQARQDILTSLQYYHDVIDTIWNEDIPAGADPQNDELFSLDPNDGFVSDMIKEKLILLSDSLNNDTALTVESESRIVYFLTNGTDSLVLSLTMGPFGTIEDSSICLKKNPLDIGYYCHSNYETEVDGDQLFCFLDASYENLGGFFTGTLSSDRMTITNASFEYWGQESGVMQNLSGTGQRQQMQEEQWTVDANPILGSSPRYPNPLSPRDYLCDFDDWNKPVAGSLPDAAIGGVLPETTETNWINWINPQPSGTLFWPLLENWQMYKPYDQETKWPAFWLDEQCIFVDAAGETDSQLPPGMDIQALYLGLTEEDLYGSILLQGSLDIESYGGGYEYSVYLSHCPNNSDAPDSILFQIKIYSTSIDAKVYYRASGNGYSYWQYAGELGVLFYPNQIDFSISMWDLPASISGRYISVKSERLNSYIEGGDQNDTHIQIGMTGSVSGNVLFPGHLGGPIFVQAFSDIDDPEGSLVAYTMLTEPGAFTLDGIGLGWRGYVRAFSPMFGDYHPLDMDAFKAQDIEAIALRVENLSGVLLSLEAPPVLETDWQSNDWNYDSINTTTNRQDYFAFDAIQGVTYQLKLNRYSPYKIRMTLLDRNGCDELFELESWQTQSIDWVCPLNGRYYIKVSEPDNNRSGGSYSVRVIAFWQCPDWDISGGQWEGVKDCRIDLHDFALLANQWLTACNEPYWCQDSDLNRNGQVEFGDVWILLSEWMEAGYGFQPEPLGDNFETGDFSKLPWHFGGNQPWRIVSDSLYEGSFSAKSGPITHNQSSQMSLSLDTGIYTSISFAHRVSCQYYYDTLRFYINNTLKATWDGPGNWSVNTFTITPGHNTFTWTYTKNYSNSYYSDCAWIDDIRFEY